MVFQKTDHVLKSLLCHEMQHRKAMNVFHSPPFLFPMKRKAEVRRMAIHFAEINLNATGTTLL